MLERFFTIAFFITGISVAGAQNLKSPVPPTLPCGSLNENGLVIAVSDVPSSFPDQRHDSSAAVALSEGTTTLPSLESDYTNNGGGHAKLSNASAQCQHGAQHTTAAALQLRISADLWAKAGHCCPGSNPGGVVNFSPAWISNFTLPGTLGTDTWNIQLAYSITKSGISPRCDWIIDAMKQIPLSLSSNSIANDLSIAPGTHTMSVFCTAENYHVDARPGGGWDHESSATDSVQMSWTVVKSEK